MFPAQLLWAVCVRGFFSLHLLPGSVTVRCRQRSAQQGGKKGSRRAHTPHLLLRPPLMGLLRSE